VRAAALLGVALLCAACGGIPDEFQSRAPLPRCEEVELGQTAAQTVMPCSRAQAATASATAAATRRSSGLGTT
jgi:hypothetical protein